MTKPFLASFVRSHRGAPVVLVVAVCAGTFGFASVAVASPPGRHDKAVPSSRVQRNLERVAVKTPRNPRTVQEPPVAASQCSLSRGVAVGAQCSEVTTPTVVGDRAVAPAVLPIAPTSAPAVVVAER